MMKLQNRIWFTLFIFILVSCGHQLPDFSSRLSTRLPTNAKTQAIGDYSLGCLEGAVTFSGLEKGMVLSQKKRGRYWGHPDLISLITNAGLEFNQLNKTIIVGDLSQSRGGPTLSGHNSHQTGLDVDVWFRVLDQKSLLNFTELETLEMKPIEKIGEDQLHLVKFFANESKVERIFINPLFKKNLCEDKSTSRLSPEVQHKLRAWWGHDDHIHIRLKCPIDSPKCLSQKPIPNGDGCGEELNWWFTDEAKNEDIDPTYDELKMIYLEKVKNLPPECSFYKELF
jgi:penicillin-insensitive murein endopeptidase